MNQADANRGCAERNGAECRENKALGLLRRRGRGSAHAHFGAHEHLGTHDHLGKHERLEMRGEAKHAPSEEPKRLRLRGSGSGQQRVRRGSLRRALAVCLIFALLMTGLGGNGLLPSGGPSFANGEFDINVPEFRAPKIDTSNPQVYTGVPYIGEIVNQIYYSDIERAQGKREIVRMTALGAWNNLGERAFRPDDSATGYETLMAVIGLTGGHSGVIQSVQSEAGTTTPPERLKLQLNKAVFDAATGRGIVQPNEVLGLEKAITRERAALFLARAVGIGQSYDQTAVYTFTDWQKVETYARPVIENLVKQGIIDLRADGSFGPQDRLPRAELAVWMSRAFDRNPALLGAQIRVGFVVGKSAEVRKEGAEEITEQTLTLREPDGKPVQIRTAKNRSGLVSDFIVHKNGITSVSRYLEIGDEIEYILVGGAVKYAGDIPNGQVLSELAIKPDQYHYTHFGTVADKKQIQEQRDGKTVTKEIYRVLDVTGDAFDIVVYEDGVTGLREDITTYKNGVIGGVHLLAVGDTVEYVTNERMEVGYIKIKDLTDQELIGTINKVEPLTETSPDYITIYSFDGQLSRYPLAPYAGLSINGRIAPLSDFVYGLNIRAKIVGDIIVSLQGESYSGEAGYVPPLGKMRMGKVLSKSKDYLTLKKSNGEIEHVYFDADTQFLKAGTPSTVTAIKPNDKLKVYYNSFYEKNAVRIEIEAPEQYFHKIYKGKLSNILPYTDELYLVGADGISKPEYIENSDWVQTDDYSEEIAIAPDCEIYVDNQRLTPEQLERSYKGYQVYVVTNELFGKETAVKISVKRGAEMLYTSSVTSVDTTQGELQLLTRDNFDLTKATIVIKDGRVVTPDQIKRRDTVLIASESPDGSYAKSAMFVNVTSAQTSLFDGVRIGAVESVSPSTVTLRNHTFITGNRFEAVNPNVSGHFKLTTHSLIQDISKPDDIKVIKPNVFYHNKYGRTENYDKTGSGLKYKRYYAFMVINPADNSILAMNMRKGGLMPLNLFDYKLKKEEEIEKELAKTFKDAVVTRGVVTGRDEVWDRFELTEAHDFTMYKARWTPTKTNIYLKHSDAIIVKNNRVIKASEVKVGDYVYILRIGTDSLVIFVE